MVEPELARSDMSTVRSVRVFCAGCRFGCCLSAFFRVLLVRIARAHCNRRSQMDCLLWNPLTPLPRASFSPLRVRGVTGKGGEAGGRARGAGTKERDGGHGDGGKRDEAPGLGSGRAARVPPPPTNGEDGQG